MMAVPVAMLLLILTNHRLLRAGVGGMAGPHNGAHALVAMALMTGPVGSDIEEARGLVMRVLVRALAALAATGLPTWRPRRKRSPRTTPQRTPRRC